MLKSKISRATVTGARVDYEGSISIDPVLMEAAGIVQYEQVHVLDAVNGERLVTYAIEGEPGQICMNGAAALKVAVGDSVIILSYAEFEPEEWQGRWPAVVKVDAANHILEIAGVKGSDA
jgi:aspartate 1-decarboxylase